MRKLFFLLYGLACYGIFLAAMLYAIRFIGNLGLSETMDSPLQIPLMAAILIDTSLLLLLLLQGSIMTRPSAWQRWVKLVPPELKRSSLILVCGLCLLFLMWCWQPVGGTIWLVEDSVVRMILHITYLTGWSLVFVSTFLINHFDLFGLRQVWLHFKGVSYTSLPFQHPDLYRLARHPLYIGFLVAFWSAPVMTITHLLFATLATIYIVVTIQREERDLIGQLREKYEQYKRWAPMLIFLSKRRRAK